MNASPRTDVMPSLHIQQAGGSPGIATAEADRRALDAIGLPQADALLDSRALSGLIGREVVIAHLRIKPGQSVVVAHQDVASCGSSAADWGWTWLSEDADKYDKTLIRAAQLGERLGVHRDSPPFLISGSVWSDRVLAKELAEARTALGPGATWQILRYNPHRRVVAVVTRPGEDGRPRRHVLRVAGEYLRPLVDTVEHWRGLGAPVTGLRMVGGRGTAVLTPLWGAADLLSHPHPPAARTAGAVMAQVHSRGTAQVKAGSADGRVCPTPTARLAAEPLSAAESVAETAPWLADRAAALAQLLSARLDAPVAPTLLHGDLSPDQVLIADETSHKIRIIDLDRSDLGPAMRDVGSWIAACRETELPELGDAFLTGYLSVADLNHSAMHAWEAYAHLTAALDSFRRRARDWPAAAARRIELAERAVNR